MAWEKGTAAGYRDLLEKLKVFASANGWTVERWVKDPDGIQNDELILSSTGPSGNEYFICGFKSDYDIGAARYNWALISGPLYSEGALFESQPNATALQYMYLWQHPIEYWLVVNHARIIVVAQVSMTTHVIYCGKLQNYCALGHWFRQVGCYGEGVNPDGRWSSQGNDYSTFQWLRHAGRQVLWIDNSYITPELVYPNMTRSSLCQNGWTYENGDHWLMPMTLLHETHGALGEFIGCYYIDGHNTSSLQQITVPENARQLLVVQNIHRNGYRDFMAVELM
ncbi:hypothetical protein ABT56_00320 [Photobacterium aquae]|uniref:Uncharacterized protein n=1 Tax=Photobacterium aquae TaxID=1195763 RepID=A0A0J1HCZ9_9GAMM|nr:hypothetical protein [Photobacterium aquae]KLV09569.1 hypothetical protein ABT56_00320 [Photobacterium aquae]